MKKEENIIKIEEETIINENIILEKGDSIKILKEASEISYDELTPGKQRTVEVLVDMFNVDEKTLDFFEGMHGIVVAFKTTIGYGKLDKDTMKELSRLMNFRWISIANTHTSIGI